MELRVIGGKFKRTKLKVPKDTRPLSGIVKSALFSVINDKIKKSYILDLYAGSGALGIEALSRGAKLCDFIDINKKACDIIKENLLKLNLSNNEVYNIPAEIFLRYNKTIDDKYDIIFVFQPYDITNEGIVSKSIHLLKKDGILIFERESNREERSIKGLNIINSKKYGKTALTFYIKD